MTELVPKTRNK